MNTTRKGDELEEKAFRLLKELLDRDDFYVPGKKSVIYKKKKYYSSKRKSDIIFDLAIETTLPGASTYSILTLIECKNYNKSIPVDDLEEFDSKISQIGEHNTKGLFITNARLQKAALDFAKTTKIGVIKLASEDEHQWVNYRIDRKNIDQQTIDAENLLMDSIKFQPPLLGLIHNKKFESLIDVCLEFKIIDFYSHSLKYETIPFIPEERFDEISERFHKQDVRDGHTLSVEKSATFLSSVYSMEFDFDADLGTGILGKIEFEPLKIMVSKSLKSDPARYKFTFAHEIAHLFLHKNLLSKGFREQTDDSETIQFGYEGSNKNKKQLEVQANILASRLLLPKPYFLKAIARVFQKYRIHRNVLFLDNQPINIKESYEILNILSEEFGTSVEVVKIRMKRMGLLIDKTDSSVRGLLSGFMKRL